MQQEQCLKNLEAKPEATILMFLIKGNLNNRNRIYRDGENRDAYWWRFKKKWCYTFKFFVNEWMIYAVVGWCFQIWLLTNSWREVLIKKILKEKKQAI